MSLKDIFCQDRAIEVLQSAFACSRSAHAYLFAGQEGVGKFKTACEWAKLLLCQKPVLAQTDAGRQKTEDRRQKTDQKSPLNPERCTPFADSCGTCDSCTTFEAGSHPDFHHVYKELIQFTKEGKGRTTPVDLPIDVIREFLIDKVAIRPSLGHGRVFVVSEAEKLNQNSQNALLKVLEEPPAYCTIILLCTRMERLLATTKSRCQVVRFGVIDQDRIVERLRSEGVDEQKSRCFAALAQGSLGRACQWARLCRQASLAGEQGGADLCGINRAVVTSLVEYRLEDVLELAQGWLEHAKTLASIWSKLEPQTSSADITRRAQGTVLQLVIAALRDAIRMRISPCDPLVNEDQKSQIGKLADRFDAEQAAAAIETCYQALRWLESSVNERLVFERLLFSLRSSDIIGGRL